MISDTENYKKLKTFFVDEYHSLKAYVKSKIDDAADRDAEDIIQDVALNIFSRAENATPIDNIAAFVYNSIRNRIIDLMRTKKNRSRAMEVAKNQRSEFIELLYGETDTPYSELMVRELQRALDKLKPSYREIIIAIDYEGHTYKNVSSETGIPIGTLMSRRHRALSLLLKELEDIKENNN
ncbi:MAG: RNA polymerase sigma factor [Maribacter sp.]|nr:RNA polymerase sigma factor [Maribacter sp.]